MVSSTCEPHDDFVSLNMTAISQRTRSTEKGQSELMYHRLPHTPRYEEASFFYPTCLVANALALMHEKKESHSYTSLCNEEMPGIGCLCLVSTTGLLTLEADAIPIYEWLILFDIRIGFFLIF